MEHHPQETRPSGTFGQRLGRTGLVTPALVVLLSAGLLFATYEKGRGRVVRFEAAVTPPSGVSDADTGPGGPPPVVLRRQPTEHGRTPEFLTATFLPGRGFNLWQLTAFLPGHGEVPLLVSVPIERAGDLLTGVGPDANGSAASSAGAAFLAPWAGRLSGTPSASGSLQTTWNNTPLFFPAQPAGSTTSTEGLLLKQVADSVNETPLPDGQAAQAIFHLHNFSNQWPGATDIEIDAELSGTTLDLTATARNVGTSAEPFGFGWHPYFTIPSGQRGQVLLTVPGSKRAPMERHDATPAGTILPVSGSAFDLQRSGGTPLGMLDLNESYLDLHAPVLADGPAAELRDPAAGYGLRIVSVTSNITNFRVIAPADKPWVVIGPNTNVPDPFGREWQGLTDNGMVNLQPGASLVWKVRLELFSPSTEP